MASFRLIRDHPALAQLLICLATGAIISVLLGQDANWDLRNYHLYNAYALLNSRIGVDLLPAGMQSTFNPLLDVPYYVLATGPLAETPRLMAAIAGLPYGALLFATLRFARWVLGESRGMERLLPWIITAMAGTAAATWCEIGTTFNDIPVSALLLGGFLLGAGRGGDRPSPGAMCAAGTMVGGAVALKPTAVAFAPGIALAMLLGVIGWRARAQAAGWFSVGAVLAAALLAGPWALVLMHYYDSPTFPQMNGLFRSPWYPPRNIFVDRYLPRDIWQALFYPFYWVREQTMMVTEPTFRDARMALAMLALPVLALAARRGALPGPRRMVMVVTAFLIGYVLWLAGFSILRYALVLEAMSAVLIVAALRASARLLAPERRLFAPGLATLTLAALLWHTRPPDFWRVPYVEHVFEVERLHLPPNSLLLTIHAPVAMAIPFLDAPGFRAIGLVYELLESRHYRLFDEMVRRINEQEGPIFSMSDLTERVVEAAPWFGLVADPTTCRPVRNNITLNGLIMFCPLRRMPPPAPQGATARVP